MRGDDAGHSVNSEGALLHITVSARIVLTSAGVRMLQEALDGGLSAYASQDGASRAAYGAELVPSLRTPVTWGGWLPFALN